MNLKEIKEIIALMNENNLNEIEIERDGLKLKLKKSAEGDMVMGTPTHYAVESLPSPKAMPLNSFKHPALLMLLKTVKILNLRW